MADLNRITVVTLNRRHELDPAVAVLVVVPIDELGDPLAGLVFGSKWVAGVFRSILHRPVTARKDDALLLFKRPSST